MKLWTLREGNTWQDNYLELKKHSIGKPGVVVVAHASNHSTLDGEAGESVQGQH